MKKFWSWLLCLGIANAGAYPLDAYDTTHMRRLQPVWQAHQAGEKVSLVSGALLRSEAVQPSGDGVASLPENDPQLARQLRAMLGDQAENYSVAVLDISDPDDPHYIAHRDDQVANVGSVGKVLVMYALLNKLAELYPDDIAARERILRDTLITSDDWVHTDSHTVPIYDPAADKIISRRLRVGDTGNLWEYLDWMMSASNNSAASMVLQQVILMERFGHEYPVPPGEAQAFLTETSARVLGDLWLAAMRRPLQAGGFDWERIRQGSPFTAAAKRRVQGTSSHATARDLVKLLNLIETNQFVDEWSSTEAKRLLYSTQRRIRYASHPALNDAAVYFKSGSYYSCELEPDFVCRKYMGNKINRLASIAIIEAPAGDTRLRYMVAVMSNVLRVNSAVAHQSLAMRIHRLIESLHKDTVPPNKPAAEDAGKAIESLAE